MEDCVLSDGTRLPKGSMVMVPVHEAWSEKHYSNPNVFDGHRFLNMRKQGITENIQHVSTAPESLGFGHGQFACPGRFWANTQLKAFMCHFIMKYDFKLSSDNPTIETSTYGFFYRMDPQAKILIRRRKEEIKLDDIV